MIFFEDWQWWLIAAIVLFILEIFLSDFLLATLGVAALVGCAVAGFGIDFTWQFAAFVFASILAFALLRPAVQRWFYRTSEPALTNIDNMAGKRGIVTTEIENETHPGRVKIGGEEWRAIAENGRLEEGARVEVVSVESATVTVRPIS